MSRTTRARPGAGLLGARIRVALAVVFLGFQATMIARARLHPARFWCWAPHDAQNEYRIDVRVDDRVLSEDEVVQRYRLRWHGINPRAIEHLFLLVAQYEQTYGRLDGAYVLVTYRTNGRAWETWRWPPE